MLFMTTEEDVTGNVPEKPGDHESYIGISPKTVSAIKICFSFACIILIIMCIGVPLGTAYNSLVDADLQVQRSAANVKTDLERRADLLPNLASTVQASATFEYRTQHDTYVEVAQARGAADAAKLLGQIRSAPAEQVAATGVPQEQQLTQILGNFVKLQEQYPDVKLNTVQQYREFGAQVTATENQILVDRQTYNNAVTQYKNIASKFPTVLVAGYWGFKPDRYQMYTPVNQTRAEEVPVITFDFSNL